MKRFITIFASAATLVSAPAFATDPSPTPAPAATPAAKDPMARRVCLVDTLTGSRIPHKVCKTRGEWIAQYGVDPLKK